MSLKMQMVQTQVLSQKMMQSMEILQMNAQELNDYIREISLENPLVDIDNNREKTDTSTDLVKKLQWLDTMNERNRSYYETMQSRDDTHTQMMDFSESVGEELSSYVMSQLLTVKITDRQYDILRYMSESLDERGYLTEDLTQIAAVFGCDPAYIGEQKKILQSLEPAGVGASDLKECLMIQLEREKTKDEIALSIVDNYLELLGKNQLPTIAKKIKCDVSDVITARDHIRKLNPKPGSGFETRNVRNYITPDVTVVRLLDQYEILLNDYAYPDIQVNHQYLTMLEGEITDETRKYLQTKLRQAEWVKSCITQRGATLMKIARTLVEYQEVFFEKGTGYLRPLRLLDVASVLGIHESTVSRAIRDKYLQCQWGCFPMHHFFSKSLEMNAGKEKVSTDTVKELIRTIIDEESKKKPYSDRLLSEMLVERGVKISRRTVAKYREEMGLMDASGRKQFQ